MNYHEVFKNAIAAGVPIDQFATKSSQVGNMVYYIVASLIDTKTVRFEQRELSLPEISTGLYPQDVQKVLWNINSTQEAILDFRKAIEPDFEDLFTNPNVQLSH